MINRNSIVSLALLAASFSPLLQAGTYVGAAAGANQGTWKVTDAVGNSVNFTRRSAMGTVFAGYGSMLSSNLYLGGEGTASLANTTSRTQNFTSTFGVVTANIKQTYTYGASILPGVVVGQGTLLYLRGGMVRTHFSYNASNAAISGSKNLTGKQVGAGIEYAYMSNLDLRLEYAYTKYNSMSAFNSSFSPRNNQLQLGIVYKS
jgi:outer membrane immunogenic protein